MSEYRRLKNKNGKDKSVFFPSIKYFRYKSIFKKKILK